MTARTAEGAEYYDVSQINIDDSNLDPVDWALTSALNPKVTYRLASRDPLEYFDFKQRFNLIRK